jgi:uncharacterized protein YcgL (UPF0745 family)
MYLYVKRQEGLERVPEQLLTAFGTPQSVMVFLLEPSRKLARVNTPEVINALEEQGYFMQMPPAYPDEEVRKRVN